MQLVMVHFWVSSEIYEVDYYKYRAGGAPVP